MSEELKPCPAEIKTFATAFFSWWWNQEGNNTSQGFDEWWKLVGQHTEMVKQWKQRHPSRNDTLDEAIKVIENYIHIFTVKGYIDESQSCIQVSDAIKAIEQLKD